MCRYCLHFRWKIVFVSVSQRLSDNPCSGMQKPSLRKKFQNFYSHNASWFTDFLRDVKTNKMEK